jgi:hypothetical protein
MVTARITTAAAAATAVSDLIVDLPCIVADSSNTSPTGAVPTAVAVPKMATVLQ